MEKPDKYGGDITKWLRWSSAFTRFIKKLDDRWPKLLGKLEQMKGMPVTNQLEEEWAWELWTSDLTPWKEYLFKLLECYTTGDWAGLVVAAEERGVFTARHGPAPQGLRAKDCVPAKDLELAIALWEKEVSL